MHFEDFHEKVSKTRIRDNAGKIYDSLCNLFFDSNRHWHPANQKF